MVSLAQPRLCRRRDASRSLRSSRAGVRAQLGSSGRRRCGTIGRGFRTQSARRSDQAGWRPRRSELTDRPSRGPDGCTRGSGAGPAWRWRSALRGCCSCGPRWRRHARSDRTLLDGRTGPRHSAQHRPERGPRQGWAGHRRKRLGRADRVLASSARWTRAWAPACGRRSSARNMVGADGGSLERAAGPHSADLALTGRMVSSPSSQLAWVSLNGGCGPARRTAAGRVGLTQVRGRHRVRSNPCRKNCSASSRATV